MMFVKVFRAIKKRLALMEYSSTYYRSLYIRYIASPLNHRIVISAIIFITAFIFRLSYYLFNKDLTTLKTIVGVPFSDSILWDMMSIHISRGEGIVGWFSSWRPFYSIIISFFYTWFGPSYSLAYVINIFSSALTVSLIYILTEKIYNRYVGISVSLISFLSITHLQDMLSTTTETIGLLFFVMSCLLLVIGIENTQNLKKMNIIFYLSGIIFSLCNLTRTLTLLSLPAYALIIFFTLKKENAPYRKRFLSLGIFVLGVIVTLSPWIIRQRMVNGIYSISGNSSALLYAATSPKYGQWNGLEEHEAGNLGYHTIKEKNEYFNKKIIENLSEYPMFYLNNVVKSFYKFLTYYGNYNKKNTFLWVFLLFLIIMLFKNISLITPFMYRAYYLLILAGLFFIHIIFPSEYVFILCIAGIGLSIFTMNPQKNMILISSLLFTGLTSAMVANAGVLERLYPMVSWLYDTFYIITFYCIIQAVVNKLFHINDEYYANKSAYVDSTIIPNNKYAVIVMNTLFVFIVIVVIFAIISSFRILYLTYFRSPQRYFINTFMDYQEKKGIISKIDTIRPGTFSENELNNETFYASDCSFNEEYKNNGKIFVEKIKIDRYIYYFTKEKLNHWHRLFKDRNYERTIFSGDISYGNKLIYYIFPERLPEDIAGNIVVVVGRYNVDMSNLFEGRKIGELIAIIKQDDMNYENYFIAMSDEHWKIISTLKEMK